MVACLRLYLQGDAFEGMPNLRKPSNLGHPRLGGQLFADAHSYDALAQPGLRKFRGIDVEQPPKGQRPLPRQHRHDGHRFGHARKA